MGSDSIRPDSTRQPVIGSLLVDTRKILDTDVSGRVLSGPTRGEGQNWAEVVQVG